MLGEELGIDTPELCKIYYGETNEYKGYNKIYPNNRISTTKYNLVNFFPKSLLFQSNKSGFNDRYIYLRINLYNDKRSIRRFPQI